MASIYRRADSKKLWLSFYPHPGADLVRVGLGTDDIVHAERAVKKVDLLIELEALADIELPLKALEAFKSLRSRPQSQPEENQSLGDGRDTPHIIIKCPIDDAIRAFLVRSMATNAEHATADKISRLRQFFGTKRIKALDPRPPEKLKHARKTMIVEPWFTGNDLGQITTTCMLEFLGGKTYKNSSKRHFRELFHELFQTALKTGIYRPDNPYCANPAADLPGFNEREEPITVLTASEVAEQYRAAAAAPLVLLGCQLMIEAGFRLHEILALRHGDLNQPGKIRLVKPRRQSSGATKLKTGERSVTVLAPLGPVITRYLQSIDFDERAWCFPNSNGKKMTSDSFGECLRQINRQAGLPWTTQDYRHTYATNRIREGWNIKTLAQEMGTSMTMLQQHYAAYIDPPVLAALNSGQ